MDSVKELARELGLSGQSKEIVERTHRLIEQSRIILEKRTAFEIRRIIDGN